MPTFSKILLKRIAADIAAHPLKDGEFRRIHKMGPHYISRESVYDGLSHLFQVDIDGVPYYIFYSTEPIETATI